MWRHPATTSRPHWLLRKGIRAALIAGALASLLDAGSARAQISSFSVGSDNTTTYPSNLPSFPDEHVTFMPSATANGYLVFASSSITGGMGGAVVLQTQDLQTFSFATSLGYADQVMNPPVGFTACNASYDSEFDENYVGPGTVIQDPTLPAGNLIMIYEAENHCPGGVNQFDYYATTGFARSSDNGQTWPAPIAAALGGTNRYPVLKSSTAEPTEPENPQINLGDAIPSAAIDGDFIYVVYEYVTSPTSPANNMMRVARANLVTDNVGGTLQFHKWYNGAFSQDGIGGLDSSPLPSLGCNGVQKQASLVFDDDLGLYVMVFLCLDGTDSEGGWYYATATSLALENWTAPQLISGSLLPWINPCPGDSSGGTQFDGFYPSLISPNAAQGHIHNTGRIYFLNGCDGGSNRAFDYREFTISGTHAPLSLTATHDFNGDGYSDIAWRNMSTGDVAIWLMNGTTVVSAMDFANVPSSWTVAGQRDFNGDGDADLLWHNADGDLSMWLLNGTAISQATDLGIVPTAWSVAGTGDFNGDGYGDILWRNTSTGDVSIWLMNGTTVLQPSDFANVPVASGWTIVGTGDFNGDGKRDILWRNTSTGDVAIWLMDGTSVSQATDFVNVPVASGWAIAGTGDFNGDGNSDILWGNTATGDVAIWLMNGTTISQATDLANVPVTSGWTIAGTGDFNGDGKSDILWSNTSTGDVATWLMNGTAISQATDFANVPVASGWTIQRLNAD